MLRRKMYDVLLDWKSRSQGRAALLVEGARRVGKSTVDLGKFKLYLADTGLFVALAFKDADFTDNIVYGKLLSDKLPVKPRHGLRERRRPGAYRPRKAPVLPHLA